MASLVDHRLIFVMGKGGTGKSTVSAALGVAAAARGKRVLVCEIAGRRTVHAALAGSGDAEAQERLDRGEEVEVDDRLAVASLDPEVALELYLRHQLPSRALFELLKRSRVFQYLVAAAPGSNELLTMGRIWEAAQLDRPWSDTDARYDMVIVDSPATGHGLALLEAPRTFAEIARVGRIRRQAERIDAFVRKPRLTAAVAVALAEEMPITETLELGAALQERIGLELSLVVANAVEEARFALEEVVTLEAERDHVGEDARAVVDAALSVHRRATLQDALVARLAGAGAPVVTLPPLTTAVLGPAEIERLADRLDPAL